MTTATVPALKIPSVESIMEDEWWRVKAATRRVLHRLSINGIEGDYDDIESRMSVRVWILAQRYQEHLEDGTLKMGRGTWFGGCMNSTIRNTAGNIIRARQSRPWVQLSACELSDDAPPASIVTDDNHECDYYDLLGSGGEEIVRGVLNGVDGRQKYGRHTWGCIQQRLKKALVGE